MQDLREDLVLMLSNGLNNSGTWQRIVDTVERRSGVDISDDVATKDAEESFVNCIIDAVLEMKDV